MTLPQTGHVTPEKPLSFILGIGVLLGKGIGPIDFRKACQPHYHVKYASVAFACAWLPSVRFTEALCFNRLGQFTRLEHGSPPSREQPRVQPMHGGSYGVLSDFLLTELLLTVTIGWPHPFSVTESHFAQEGAYKMPLKKRIYTLSKIVGCLCVHQPNGTMTYFTTYIAVWFHIL